MIAVSNNGQTTEELQSDIASLRERLHVAEETLDAIRHGEIDSLVAQTAQGPRVFTLVDAYTPYRTFVEGMQHGAATLSADGTILYCNASLPAMLRTPIECVIGASWHTLVTHESAEASARLLVWAAEAKASDELTLRAADGTLVPVTVVAHPLAVDGVQTTCLVITDLTERKRVEEEARKLAAIVEATEEKFRTQARNHVVAGFDFSPTAAKGYGIAILAVALAFLARWILWPVMGGESPFVLHWPAIVVAAWYGGFRAGVLATVLSALGTAYFLMEPKFTLAIANTGELVGLSFLLLMGVGFSLFIARARQSDRARLAAYREAHASQASSAYYRSLIEANLDPMVIKDPAGKITDVNLAAETATGRTRAELIGTGLPDYITEPDKARQLYHQVHRDGHVRNVPLEMRHRDGHTTPVLYNAAVYRDQAGNVVGVVATVRDISERIKAEQAREESAAAFRTLAESVPQLVWMCQPDGLNIYFNQRWVDYTGLTLEESYGRGWNTPFHPDDKEPAWQAWNQAVATVGEYRIECRLRGADGSYRWFLTRGLPLRDSQGTIVKWFGTCTDIDDLKRAQQELHGLNKELEQRVQQRTLDLQAANKELEAFAYSVSHDLRSPLRAIDGFSQILLKEYVQILPEKPQHYLQVVCDNARQMGRLIDDLLRFSRSNRQSVQVQPVDPGEIVRSCLEELQPEREGRQVEIQIGALPECWADGGLLRQVWFNLLANALKYSRKRDPAMIEIGSETRDGATVYFVRDNGVGFDMQYAHKLFGVFQRLHAAEDYEGTGIGLALVQRILHRHGGRIWAEARVDQGATFFFTLGRSTPHA